MPRQRARDYGTKSRSRVKVVEPDAVGGRHAASTPVRRGGPDPRREREGALVPYRLTVLGTGYLGATHAACMADLGYEVLGLDVDAAKIARLQAGDLPIYEPGLEELLKRNLEAGRLRFTTSYEEAAEFGDVHFICVGTPQKPGEY